MAAVMASRGTLSGGKRRVVACDACRAKKRKCDPLRPARDCEKNVWGHNLWREDILSADVPSPMWTTNDQLMMQDDMSQKNDKLTVSPDQSCASKFRIYLLCGGLDVTIRYDKSESDRVSAFERRLKTEDESGTLHSLNDSAGFRGLDGINSSFYANGMNRASVDGFQTAQVVIAIPQQPLQVLVEFLNSVRTQNLTILAFEDHDKAPDQCMEYCDTISRQAELPHDLFLESLGLEKFLLELYVQVVSHITRRTSVTRQPCNALTREWIVFCLQSKPTKQACLFSSASFLQRLGCLSYQTLGGYVHNLIAAAKQDDLYRTRQHGGRATDEGIFALSHLIAHGSQLFELNPESLSRYKQTLAGLLDSRGGLNNLKLRGRLDETIIVDQIKAALRT